MTASAWIFLAMFLSSLASMVVIFIFHSRQMNDLQKMLFAGNPEDYQRIKGNKKGVSKNDVGDYTDSFADKEEKENLVENNPISLEEITGVQVDNEPVKEVKIYKT